MMTLTAQECVVFVVYFFHFVEEGKLQKILGTLTYIKRLLLYGWLLLFVDTPTLQTFVLTALFLFYFYFS